MSDFIIIIVALIAALIVLSVLSGVARIEVNQTLINNTQDLANICSDTYDDGYRDGVRAAVQQIVQKCGNKSALEVDCDSFRLWGMSQ